MTLRISTDMATQLDDLAKRFGRKRSEIVRLALEQFIAVPVETRPIDRVRDLLGSIESGIPDLGQRHREYLLTIPGHANGLRGRNAGCFG